MDHLRRLPHRGRHQPAARAAGRPPVSVLDTLQVDSVLSYLIALVIPALDAIFPVLPSETAVITLGVTTAGSTDPRIALLVACAAAGAFLGDNLCYLLGRRFGPAVERRFFAGPKGARTRAWAERSLDRYRPAADHRLPLHPRRPDRGDPHLRARQVSAPAIRRRDRRRRRHLGAVRVPDRPHRRPRLRAQHLGRAGGGVRRLDRPQRPDRAHPPAARPASRSG